MTRYCTLLLAGLLSLAGCGTLRPATYVHPNFDFSRVKKVAVLPLENLTTDQAAGEKMRKVVITELLATGIVDAIEPGQVNRVLAQQNIQSPTALLPEDFKRLGASLGAQLLVVGSVEAFDRVTVGGVQAPEVTLTLRGVDAESGTVVWAASHTEGGATFAARLFGLTGDSLSEVARKAAHEAVATLFR
ncbi:MAG TPA: CsgG/HfaB family protein [Candidatus Methylomirabilis sp.]|nr:CsgG/HfaB family protein [Candidatus Methylomirabilis sp.]